MYGRAMHEPPPLSKKERAREEIAAAALQVIARRGVAAASLRQVAHELNRTTGVLTHHFRDRDDLLDQAVTVATTAVLERAMPVLGEDPAVALRRLACALVIDDEHDAEQARAAVHLLSHALPDPVARARQRESRDRLRTELRWAFEALLVAGRVRGALDPEREAQRLACLMEGLRIQTLLDPLAYPADTQRTLLLEHLARIGIAR
jgi:AcrR family transcriptional regulator